MNTTLEFGSQSWVFGRPRTLGILNVTPDSFSDGGALGDHASTISRALSLIDEGADAVDVGGESTRPGAEPVDARDEIARVVPVVEALAAEGAVVSIDTRKADVAERALAAGARILNDVGMGDPPSTLGAVAARYGAAVIVMHSRADPRTMRSSTAESYGDVVSDVTAELQVRIDGYLRAGVSHGRLAVDPGIGFAKSAQQSIELIANVATLRTLGYPVCVGPSRKSFIDARDAYADDWQFVSSEPRLRLGGTAAAVTAAVLAGAEILRVHDVRVMVQAARIAHAIRARSRLVSPGGAR